MTASVAYRALSGIFCIYKPPHKTMGSVIKHLKTNIVEGLNKLPRPVKQRIVYHEENIGTALPVVATVPDLADHPLVVGKPFIDEDFFIKSADQLSENASGVLVMNINGGRNTLNKISSSGHVKVYHVKGQFGRATIDYTPTGKLVEKTTFRHVRQEQLDRVLAATQAAHQKHMYKVSGVNLQTQEAYELATRGLLRPKVGKISNPMIYGIKCTEFDLPHFTIEIHCVNETCEYLMKLIHDIGLQMKSTAVCSQLRRTRYGHFTVHHALARNQFKPELIAQNIQQCRALVTPDKLLSEGNIIDYENDLLESGEKLFLSQQRVEE